METRPCVAVSLVRATFDALNHDVACEEIELTFDDLVWLAHEPHDDGRLRQMAVLRDRPYAQFNFLVDLGTGETDGPEAGFQECSAISMSVDVIEYRNGNEKENNPRKLTGLHQGRATSRSSAGSSAR